MLKSSDINSTAKVSTGGRPLRTNKTTRMWAVLTLKEEFLK